MADVIARPVAVQKSVQVCDDGRRRLAVTLDLIEAFDPYDRQARFVASNAHFVYFLGGIGSGKTFGLMLWCLRKVLENPGLHGLIAGRTMTDVDRSLLPVLMAMIDRVFRLTGVQLLRRHDRGNQRLVFNNGAVVYLYGYNRIDKVRGLNLTWAAADETEWSEADPDDVFDVLSGRLRETTPGKSPQYGLAFASSPNGLRGIVKRFFDAQQVWREGIETGDPDKVEQGRLFHLVTATSHDNPHLPPSYFMRMRTMSRRRYQQEVEGKVLRPALAIYEIAEHHFVEWRPARDRVDGLRHRVIGIDWGNHNGKHAAIDIDVDERTGVWTVVDELIDDERPLGHFLPHLVKWIRRPGRPEPFMLAPDRAIRDANASLARTFGSAHLKPMDSKDEQRVKRGIELVQYMLDPHGEDVRLQFHRGLAKVATGHTAPLIPAMRGYQWRKDRYGIPLTEPHKDDVTDHACDALRYAVVASLYWPQKLHAGRRLFLSIEQFEDTPGNQDAPRHGHSSRHT